MLEGGGAPKCPCKNVNMPEYWLLVLLGTHSSRFKCKMVSTPECSDKNIFRGGKKWRVATYFGKIWVAKTRQKLFGGWQKNLDVAKNVCGWQKYFGEGGFHCFF